MPGLTPLTVMPSGPSSSAKERTRLSTAAFAPPSRPWPGMAWKESMPEIATMRPARPRMRGRAAWTAAMNESTEIAKVRRTLCSFCSISGRKDVAAALATRMSTRPKASPTRSMTGGTSDGWASSSGRASPLTPSRSISATTSAARSALRL